MGSYLSSDASILDYGRQNLEEMDEFKIGVIFELFV